MATHSSILAWKIPWAEELMGYSPWGHKESDMTERLTLSFITPEQSHREHSRKEDTTLDLSAQRGRLIRKKVMGKSFHQCNGGMM